MYQFNTFFMCTANIDAMLELVSIMSSGVRSVHRDILSNMFQWVSRMPTDLSAMKHGSIVLHWVIL
jgi:hypothetical protein